MHDDSDEVGCVQMQLQMELGVAKLQPTLLLEVGVPVGPGPGSTQVCGGGWGEVLSLVKPSLLIGSEIATRAKHSAGCNASQLGTQEVGLCSWEGGVGRHLHRHGR